MRPSSKYLAVAADAAFCFTVALVALILVTSINESSVRGRQSSLVVDKPCDEIYVVGEGETLNTISDKCADPYIVERNPHIHDPDDVFPGLVIKIVPLAR